MCLGTECFSPCAVAGNGMQACVNISPVTHRAGKGHGIYAIWNREASESHTADLCLHFKHLHAVGLFMCTTFCFCICVRTRANQGSFVSQFMTGQF